MGCRIMHDRELNVAALYCSTTDVAFGPLFEESDNWEADERAEAFCRWLVTDPRILSEPDLMARYSEWRSQEDAQYKRENPEMCFDCGNPVGCCDDDCSSKSSSRPLIKKS